MSEKYIGKDVFGNSISMAEADAIGQQRSNVDRLLLIVGDYMGWDGDISHVFVSDLTQMGDFCLRKKELAQISNKLGFEVSDKDYLHEIALRIRPTN